MKQGKAKTGRLSDGSKVPVKPEHGLDWGAIREARAKRLEGEIEVAAQLDQPLGVEHEIFMMGLTPHEEEKLALGEMLKKPSTPKVSRPGTGGRRKAFVKADVDRLVEMYQGRNMSPNEIAEETGFHRDTIIRYLKTREGVWDPNRHKRGNHVPVNKKGPRPERQQQECSRGHDLSEPGATRQLYKSKKKGGGISGRECIKCRDWLNIERWRRKVLEEWDQAQPLDQFSLRQYLSYLLISKGLSGTEGKTQMHELKKKVPTLNMREQRTRAQWEASEIGSLVERMLADG